MLRIYPAWIVNLLFCVLLVAPLSRPDHHLYLRDPATCQFFLPLTLQQGPVGLPGVFIFNPFPVWVNGSLWTIPWEVLCYLMVAALGLIGAFRSRTLTLALFAALLAYNLGLDTRTTSAGGTGPPSFRTSATSWPCSARRPLPGRGAAVSVSGRRSAFPVLAVGALAALILLAWWPPLSPLWPLAYPIFNCYLLFYVAYGSRIALHDFGRRGDLSYGVYLYGFPIQQTLIQHIQHRGHVLTPLTLFLTAWPLACFFAMLSWRFVEKPFLKLKASPGRPRPISGRPCRWYRARRAGLRAGLAGRKSAPASFGRGGAFA